ncbi:MAG: prepilin-type N-terminal cleavage/methylation domain-containing protein [Planctomycetaceae bacterium]|nr:prepilin-type N-terminal cleavage/methylation domain-containing protein [Planctomycetaceae bacterium]
MRRLRSNDDTPAASRSGFSLIEVILATAILMGSVVVLGELAGIGRRQAQRGRDFAEAHERCELLLNEILLGLKPLLPVEQEPLEEAVNLFQKINVDFDSEAFDEFDPFAPDMTDSEAFSSDGGIDEPQPDWLYSIIVEPLPERPGLALLRVSVEQSPEKFPRPVYFELSRWIEDPSPQEESEFGSFDNPRQLSSTGRGALP